MPPHCLVVDHTTYVLAATISVEQLACMQADKGNFAAFSKVRGLLTSASEELRDVPLYYNLHTMCKTLRVTPPSNSTVRSAIVNAGEAPVYVGRRLPVWH